jgi:alkanesulfonate monooxygenase SsuD/methylene tetrahydromethanopterin reductase-like flavin-dependent oxidoreductase (luciferase family)
VRPDGPQSAVIRAYRSGLAASGTAPRIGVSRTIYPTDSRAEALSVLEAGTRTWSERMLQNDAWRSLDTDDLLAYHNIHWGPAGQIAEQLAADTALAQATDILVQFQPGEPDFAQTVRALTTIALDIAPALGWQRTAA